MPLKDIQTIFNELNLDDVKRFEEIISSEHVNCALDVNGISKGEDAISISIKVNIKGIDGYTSFGTNFVHSDKTFQLVIKQFLEWWDREVVRFNSFSQLTKSNKK